jgi:hypothetical protein
MPIDAAPSRTDVRPPTSARGRYGVLLVTTVLSLAVQGAVPPSPVQRVVVTVLAAASLLLAFHAARSSWRASSGPSSAASARAPRGR